LEKCFFFRNFAHFYRLMCRYYRILFALAVACLWACQNNISVQTFQQRLNSEMNAAQTATDRVKELLQRESLDSLYQIVSNNADCNSDCNPNRLFYIFNDKGLVFWSDNWLSINIDRLEGYDKWYYHRFGNAHTICRWQVTNNYTILTVIPIKYAYPFENQWLQNDFISPFNINPKWDITPIMDDEALAIYNNVGDYLFSLKSVSTQSTARQPDRIPSFSYQNLFGGGNRKTNNKTRLWMWIMLSAYILIFIIIIVWAVYQIVKHHGFRNLPLRVKILLCFGLLLTASFVYIGIMSATLLKDRYIEGQKQMLHDKSLYLQAALKSKLAYLPAITSNQSHDLNLELKELSLSYNTDIHVYDLMGTLISTSFPEVFDSGLLSRYISPEPMFQTYINAQSKNNTTGEPIIVYEQIGKMRYMAAYIECLNWDDIQLGFISIPFYISENAVEESLNRVMLQILPVYLFLFVMLIVFSIIISRALTRPIAELSKRLRNLDPGRTNEKLLYYSTDEVGDLVESYNKMVDDLNRNVMSLTEKERESAWQTMARQVAHEINNPLTPMKLTVQQMQRAKQVGGERFDKYFDKATIMLIDQIDTLSRIAGSFSAFAKNLPDEINLNSVDVAQKLVSAITMYANYQNLNVRYIGPESDVFVYADVEQIGRVFTNILQNAVQAIEQHPNGQQGDIIVMLKQDKEWVEISISDNGPGIPNDLREKIFLPNFTTKTTGMGLGLAMCKNIVGRSGGELWFESKEGKGTTFFIKLRLAQ